MFVKLNFMKSKTALFVLILLLLSMKDVQSQINKKLTYNRVAKKNSVWYYAAHIYGIKDDYDFVGEELVKIYGEDSLSNAYNIFKIDHTIDSLQLWDVTSIHFISDTQIRVYGTYFIKSFQLGSDKDKKVIIRKNEEGVNSIMKVNIDDQGRKFIRVWKIDDYIDIDDKDLKSIEVKNKNKWFYTEAESRRFVQYYQLARYPVKLAYAVSLVAIAAYSYKMGK
jgi:hypothetical protein